MTEHATGPAALAAGVTELWARFRPAILARVGVLEEAAVALLGAELGAEQRGHAEREAHKLAGSVGTFGFTEASRHARSIELLLEGSAPLAEGDVLRLSERVHALRLELERSPAPAAPSPPAAGRPALLLLTPDAELAERVEMEASARGFAVRWAPDVEGARALLAEGPPAAVVLDLPTPADYRRLFLPLDALLPLAAPAPVVVLAARDALAERVAAARRGARALLRRPVSPVQLVDAVERTLPRRPGAAGTRLLVVDDDPHALRLLESLLAGRGIQVHPVQDPTLFWRELGRTLPDLVVLDLDMPRLNGIDLCRALRSDPRWCSLPVLFLTGRTDAASVQAVFAAGADDYVAKPVVGPELVVRIENRLERTRLQGAEHAAGPAGLPGRQRAGEEISRLLQLARRTGAGVAVARVDVDGIKALGARLGAAAADEALKRVALLLQAHVAAGDVVGWWGGDEFVVGLFGADREEAAQRLAEARAALGRERVETAEGELGVTFSAGVACHPADGADLPGLAAAAGQALARAKQAGGARVLAHRADPGAHPAELVEVALVEDDPVVAELLLHALGVQGYSARWLRDGDEAVQALAGEAPPLRARVLLLDVDLPGRDGLAVLRELARHRVVERTRVVMLTVRSTEREVLAALELGAADHVAKPFSVPVLLRRVRALLERG